MSTTSKNRTNWDYRTICPCQHHSHRHQGWQRVARMASRGAAVLVTVPLAMMALDFPMKAMSIDLNALRIESQPKSVQSASLPIFTTPAVRAEFLTPRTAAILPAIDVFKEQYFRAYIPYGDIIYREARKNDLPPELVAAMVHTESDFRPRLVSHKSAQGLMQIVPETARLLGIANPFDPEQNIAAGTKYFRYLLDRFDDETMALAAYNAGEGNVERFGGVPPFAETQQYIQRVNYRAHHYRQRVRTTYMASIRMRNAAN